jgi:hypothetical protein
MNTEPTRSDDDLPEPESYESAGSLRPLGGHLGAAMASLQSNIDKHLAERQSREPEEKPEPLPLVDEEELAAIADPANANGYGITRLVSTETTPTHSNAPKNEAPN